MIGKLRCQLRVCGNGFLKTNRGEQKQTTPVMMYCVWYRYMSGLWSYILINYNKCITSGWILSRTLRITHARSYTSSLSSSSSRAGDFRLYDVDTILVLRSSRVNNKNKNNSFEYTVIFVRLILFSALNEHLDG